MQKKAAVFMLVIFVGIATAVLAQSGPRRGMPLYDPKTELTLSGSVDDIQTQGCMGRGLGTHLMVKTQTETVEVCVGPSSFIQQKGFSFAKGDQVDVTGSKVKLGQTDVVIARQITKDNQTLTLRDTQGIPQWAGARRRSN